VFALYFRVPIKELSGDKAAEIKKMCAENEFYEITNNNI